MFDRQQLESAYWYCPGHVAGYLDASTVEEAINSTTLISIVDETEEGPYIPVFNSHEDCDTFVRELTDDHKDLVFIVCKFNSLSQIYRRVKQEFKKDKIKIVIKESNLK